MVNKRLKNHLGNDGTACMHTRGSWGCGDRVRKDRKQGTQSVASAGISSSKVVNNQGRSENTQMRKRKL